MNSIFFFLCLAFTNNAKYVDNPNQNNRIIYIVDSISPISSYVVELKGLEEPNTLYFFNKTPQEIDSVINEHNYSFIKLLENGYPYFTRSAMYLFNKNSNNSIEEKINFSYKFAASLTSKIILDEKDSSYFANNVEVNIYKINHPKFLLGVINKEFINFDANFRASFDKPDEQLVYVAFPR